MGLRTVLMIGILAGAAGAAELKIASGLLNSGAPVKLNITLESGGDAVSALQFDVEFDAAALDVSIEAGPAAVDAVKGLRSAAVGAGRLRAIILGTNQNSVADGVVAVLTVTLKGKVEPGRSYPIKLSAASGANGKAQMLTVSGRAGAVTILNKKGVK